MTEYIKREDAMDAVLDVARAGTRLSRIGMTTTA